MQTESAQTQTNQTETHTEAKPKDCFRIVAGHKNVSSRGRIRAWWYRMRWNGVRWEYFSDTWLPLGNWSASLRHCDVVGTVNVGDLVLQHNYKGPITDIYLAVKGQDGIGELKPLGWIANGCDLLIALPDGQSVTLPNPRPRGKGAL